ncbi:hypothetical protein [Algiphilus aromaticivorans]|jgi:hypothetical protein|uniref:hypothetical protein n=1 Tax=Algiphilus aromaticivorans TaxID=382454 RepID=UPI000693364D|nr:hypothetical protein [Algiphilus aromaticivorans]
MSKKYIVTALMAGLPLTAAAQGLSYNYVDVRYGDADNLDGIVGEISGQISDEFFLRGGVSLLSDSGVDADIFTGELGMRHAIDRDVDLLGTIGVQHVEVEAGNTSRDDTGLLATGGVRTMLTPEVELEGTLIYEDNDLIEDGLDARFGGLYHFTPRLALGANYRIDNELLTLGARYDFAVMR